MKQCDICGKQIEENDVIRAVVYKTSLMVAKSEDDSYVKVRTLCPECDSKIEAFIEEVKHGEWINGFCSICGELNPTNRLNERTLEFEDKYLPYCPNCGAKMSGDGKNDL